MRVAVRLDDMRSALGASVEDVSVIPGVPAPIWWDGKVPRLKAMSELIYYHATPDPTELDIRWVASARRSGYWYVSAWNDYTGWGCQDGVTVRWAPDLPSLVSLGLEAEDRRRWGLEVASEDVSG